MTTVCKALLERMLQGTLDDINPLTLEVTVNKAKKGWRNCR